MQTPHQILGPFFPLGLRPATQGNLTIVKGAGDTLLTCFVLKYVVILKL